MKKGRYAKWYRGLAGLLLVASLLPGVASATSEIQFGYSPDGSPVSFYYHREGMLGYCGGVWNFLKNEGYTLHRVELAVDERFEKFAARLEGKPGIQCGPSSRTAVRAARLASDQPTFSGSFSRTFAVTSTKLLIRNNRLDMLETDSQKVRIGILNPSNYSEAVTSSLVRQVYPNSVIVDLESREDALERLQQDAGKPTAIDAYASDEIILYDMLSKNIRQEHHQDYSIFPTLYGFSREEYVLVVYNHPDLLSKLNNWIGTAEGQDAAARLQPPLEIFTRILMSLNRADHLESARWGLIGLTLVASIVPFLMWHIWRRPEQLLMQAGDTDTDTDTDTIKTSGDKSLPRVEGRKLTEQEIRVALLKVKNYTSKEIAREIMKETGLDLSHRTVENHIQNIYRKSGTRSILDLVEFLRQEGLLDP